MFNKKYFLILFLLVVAIGTISSISAEDIGPDVQTTSGDNGIEDSGEIASGAESQELSTDAADENLQSSEASEVKTDDSNDNERTHVTLKGSKFTTTYKSEKSFKLKIVDDKGNRVSGVKVIADVYKGSKKVSHTHYETVSDGTLYYYTDKYDAGTYTFKAKISNTDKFYGNGITVKFVVNPKPYIITAKRYDGELDIFVKSKDKKKPVNNMQLLVKVRSGKKYIPVYLTTATNKKISNDKGMAAILTTALSAGNHRVVITFANKNYKGSLTTSIYISKKLKRSGSILILYSKGKLYYYRGF